MDDTSVPSTAFEPSRPVQARSRDKLRLIMAAATELINAQDLEVVTVSDIAAKAGVATGTVYQRFRDKEALLGAVIADFAGAMRGRIFTAVEAAAGGQGEAHTIVKALAAAMVHEYRQNAGLMKAATGNWARAGEDSRIGEPVRLMAVDLGHLLLELFKPHMSEFSDSYPERAISQALQFMFGILMFEATTDAGPLRLDGPYMEKELVRMFCRYTGLKTSEKDDD